MADGLLVKRSPLNVLEMPLNGSSVGNASVEFLRAFRVCAGCSHWERLGADNDGGYETCMDDMPTDGGIVAALSLGVREEDAWAADVNRRLKVPVYQFDCTIGVPATKACPGCTFFPKCIRSEDGEDDAFKGRSWSLREVLRRTNLSDVPDRSLLMKMDIESSEWPVLAGESPELLRKFRALSVEFHVLRVQEEHARKLRSLQRLQEAGFLVAHIHGNDWAPFVRLGPYEFPDVLEAHLVSNAAQAQDCDEEPGDLPDDMRNNPKGPDFPPALLPTYGGVSDSESDDSDEGASEEEASDDDANDDDEERTVESDATGDY